MPEFIKYQKPGWSYRYQKHIAGQDITESSSLQYGPPRTVSKVQSAGVTQVVNHRHTVWTSIGQFSNEKREEFTKKAAAAGDTSFGAGAKLLGAAWLSMSAEEKASYEKKFADAMAAFKAYKESDDYVAPERKAKKGEEPKRAKDKDVPKKPVGGAYGIFMQEKRAEFTKQAEAAGDTGFGAAAKLASVAWKTLPEEEKLAYDERFKVAMAKYKEDMAAYAETHSMQAGGENKFSPAKGTNKRASNEPAPHSAKAARGKSAAKIESAMIIDLGAAVQAEADKHGYGTALVNLARRPELAGKDFDGNALLKALQNSGGLVNKAKATLLGA